MLVRHSTVVVAVAVVAVATLVSCKESSHDALEAGVSTEAGAALRTDLSTCAGCQLAAQQPWTFVGIYRDDGCQEPLVQQAPPACSPVPALGSVSVTYAEEVGLRRAGEVATVTLTEHIAPAAKRYRKSGRKCLRVDESAVDLTPVGCVGQKVCRDATGTLACANCRAFANGCPDYEETRIYAAVVDPATNITSGEGAVGPLLRCCTELVVEAKRHEGSPNADRLNGAAARCNALAHRHTANHPFDEESPPKLGAIRKMFAGHNIPSCNGL